MERKMNHHNATPWANQSNDKTSWAVPRFFTVLCTPTFVVGGQRPSQSKRSSSLFVCGLLEAGLCGLSTTLVVNQQENPQPCRRLDTTSRTSFNVWWGFQDRHDMVVIFSKHVSSHQRSNMGQTRPAINSWISYGNIKDLKVHKMYFLLCYQSSPANCTSDYNIQLQHDPAWTKTLPLSIYSNNTDTWHNFSWCSVVLNSLLTNSLGMTTWNIFQSSLPHIIMANYMT